MSFRLLSAEFEGREIPLSLPDHSQEKNSNYCTIITGRNGIGKSRFLAQICRVFDGLHREGRLSRSGGSTNQKMNSPMRFELNFEIEEDHVTLHSGGWNLGKPTVNHSVIEDFLNVPLPNRVIATTITPFDKFPVGSSKEKSNLVAEERENLSIYRYLGSKNRVGQVSSNAQLYRVIEALLFSSTKERADVIRLNRVFEFLGYHPRITVKFRCYIPKNVLWIYEQPTLPDPSFEKAKMLLLSEVISQYSRDYRIRETLQTRLANDTKFAQEIKECLFAVLPELSKTKVLQVNIDLNAGISKTLDIYKYISTLRQFGLISLSDFRLSKMNANLDEVSVRDASSGEQSVVLTLLGIASEIEDNSLIIIDEPEMSLHPEWQEKFIPLMTSTFSGYHGCHFLLATHSPQIVAHAAEEPCVVVAMDDLTIEDASDFFKRSADFQLVEAFNAPGYRNEYLGRIALSTLNHFASRDTNIAEFKEKLELLQKSRVRMQNDDPIAVMIDAILEANSVNGKDEK